MKCLICDSRQAPPGHDVCEICTVESLKAPCPNLNTDNLTCSHPDIPFYDIICSTEVCPNA